jgi:hypothetical protein
MATLTGSMSVLAGDLDTRPSGYVSGRASMDSSTRGSITRKGRYADRIRAPVPLASMPAGDPLSQTPSNPLKHENT